MNRYIALLRGINVGGRVIKSADLKQCFEENGLTDVTTVLQSGNVIFTSDEPDKPRLKQLVETALEKKFSYPAKAQVFTETDLKNVVQGYPYDQRDTAWQNYIVFFENGLENELVECAGGLDPQLEQLSAGQGVLYWRVRKGMTLKSDVAKFLTKAKYQQFHTNRNINTLNKLQNK